jgi:hypothetical protein
MRPVLYQALGVVIITCAGSKQQQQQKLTLYLQAYNLNTAHLPL